MSAFKILSIDGGGARGIIPAMVCREIEVRAKKPISQLFHRIAGTSTGSILTTGLSAPKVKGSKEPRFSADAIVDVYRDMGPVIFSKGSLNKRLAELEPGMNEILEHIQGKTKVAAAAYVTTHVKKIESLAKDAVELLTKPLHDNNKLAYLLWEKLGDLRMKDALTDAFVYAYDVGSMSPQILGSRQSAVAGARDYSNYYMYQAATASSSAGPFFPPFPVYKTPLMPIKIPLPLGDTYIANKGSGEMFPMIDGGCGGLANPSLLAYLEPRHKNVKGRTLLVSLGTGHAQTAPGTDSGPNSFSTTGYDVASKWGVLQWVLVPGGLIPSLMDGESEVTHGALDLLANVAGDMYKRLQISLPPNLNFMDEGSTGSMSDLEGFGRMIVEENDAVIDEIVGVLKEPDELDSRPMKGGPLFERLGYEPQIAMSRFLFPYQKKSVRRSRPTK